jgi:hypothetical protein
MATKVTTTLVDDIDNTQEAAETVTFALDGTSYEIDLTESNAKTLRTVISQFAQYGRVTSRPASTSSKRRDRHSGSDYDPAKVREWAKGQGIELSARGRISADVIAAYKAGH